MATLRLFAGIREAAGTGRIEIDSPTVDSLLDAATTRLGPAFADMIPICRVWLNGEPTSGEARLGDADEVALLPPVSGG